MGRIGFGKVQVGLVFVSCLKWSRVGGQSLRRLPLELFGRKVTQC
jgi:hypothetical protein